MDLALVIGTEATFGYIQGFALEARRVGALLVEVNPSRTVISDVVDVRIGEPASVLEGVPFGAEQPPGRSGAQAGPTG
ncbi:MAG: hypothetical protein P8177_03215 [Gemmatimonadota bacterium]